MEKPAERVRVSYWASVLALGICPSCGHPMSQQQQIKGCVYGLPCGCLLFRGKLDSIVQKKGP